MFAQLNSLCWLTRDEESAVINKREALLRKNHLESIVYSLGSVHRSCGPVGVSGGGKAIGKRTW